MEFMGLKKEWMSGDFKLEGEKLRVISAGVLMNGNGPFALYRFSNGKTHTEPVCPCCVAGLPVDAPRACPICGQTFKGKGWGRMAQHWKAKHQDLMSYENFRKSLCEGHQ